MKVNKASNYSRREPQYLFDPFTDSPINIFSSIVIIDKFTDAKEFRKVIDLMRYYLALPLESLPQIPIYSEERQLQHRLQTTLDNPMNDIRNIIISPTYLGAMTLNAHIAFPSHHLRQVALKTHFRFRSHGTSIWNGSKLLEQKRLKADLDVDAAVPSMGRLTTFQTNQP